MTIMRKSIYSHNQPNPLLPGALTSIRGEEITSERQAEILHKVFGASKTMTKVLVNKMGDRSHKMSTSTMNINRSSLAPLSHHQHIKKKSVLVRHKIDILQKHLAGYLDRKTSTVQISHRPKNSRDIPILDITLPNHSESQKTSPRSSEMKAHFRILKKVSKNVKSSTNLPEVPSKPASRPQPNGMAHS